MKREHGTVKEYRRGCRCEDCKAANNVYMKEYRERQRSALDNVTSHFTSVDLGNLNWMDRARCKGMDNEIFFPSRGEGVDAARAICAECDVVDECLAFALRTNQEVGVWGGKSIRERDAMRNLLRIG